MRGSLDVDIYRNVARQVAEEDVRAAAAIDLGDWFRFEVGNVLPIANDSTRLPINATIGGTTWVQFHIDLTGTDLRMTGQPDDVPPIARGIIPDAEQRGYRAYPLVDHIADKVAATYQRYGDARLPSTRYRDLVDLVAIVRGATIPAQAQRAALLSEFERRRIELPFNFEAPNSGLWKRGYAAEARKSLLTGAATLDDALGEVRPFLDPVLAGTASGTWDPAERAWR